MMQSDFIIRKAVRKDYKTIIALGVKVWSKIGMFYVLNKKYNIGTDKTIITQMTMIFKKMLKGKPNVVVTEYKNKIVGFMFYTFDYKQKIGEICYNAVDNRYRGKRIGSVQCDKVLDVFRRNGMKYAKVFTGLDDDSEPARKMYEKSGFHSLIPSITYFRKL